MRSGRLSERVTELGHPLRFEVMTALAIFETATGAAAPRRLPVVRVIAEARERGERLCRLLADARVETSVSVGTTADGARAEADAVVLALDSTGREAIGAVRALRGRLAAAILVVATPARDHDVRLLVKAGAQGVVLDKEAGHALVPALQAVLAGQLSLPRQARHQAVRDAISHREQQILALMATGATNRQIGDALYLTESTVKSHLASAFAKLGVRSRAEAAAVLEEIGA